MEDAVNASVYGANLRDAWKNPKQRELKAATKGSGVVVTFLRGDLTTTRRRCNVLVAKDPLETHES